MSILVHLFYKIYSASLYCLHLLLTNTLHSNLKSMFCPNIYFLIYCNNFIKQMKHKLKVCMHRDA